MDEELKKIKFKKSKIINLIYKKKCKIIGPVNIYGSTFGENVFVGPFVEIQKKTKTMVFVTCELTAENKIVATASGVWKILKLSGAGPGG